MSASLPASCGSKHAGGRAPASPGEAVRFRGRAAGLARPSRAGGLARPAVVDDELGPSPRGDPRTGIGYSSGSSPRPGSGWGRRAGCSGATSTETACVWSAAGIGARWTRPRRTPARRTVPMPQTLAQALWTLRKQTEWNRDIGLRVLLGAGRAAAPVELPQPHPRSPRARRPASRSRPATTRSEGRCASFLFRPVQDGRRGDERPRRTSHGSAHADPAMCLRRDIDLIPNELQAPDGLDVGMSLQPDAAAPVTTSVTTTPRARSSAG